MDGKAQSSSNSANTEFSIEALTSEAEKRSRNYSDQSIKKPKTIDELQSSGHFLAFEDDPLIVDTSSNPDGITNIEYQWQISTEGINYRDLPSQGQSFTPRQSHVGSIVRVLISYKDYAGRYTEIVGPWSKPVQNVNDGPKGAPIIKGAPHESSKLSVDLRGISDEDGVGQFAIYWQRSKMDSEWALHTATADPLVLTAGDVGFSFRAVVAYRDDFGTMELLVSLPTQPVVSKAPTRRMTALPPTIYYDKTDEQVCSILDLDPAAVVEAERRGLSCLVGENTTQTATAARSDYSAAKLEAERQGRLKAEAELLALKAQKEEQQEIIAADNQVPLIDILSVETNGTQGLIKGRVSDNSGVAEVVVDGKVVPVTAGGSFEYRTFVSANGITFQIQATDPAGLTSVMSVPLERSASTATASITFDRLNPLGKQVVANRNALALIVGVADYENTPAKAIFADSDALMFRDYASEKLGIPENRIKTLVDDGADIREVLLGVKNWLARAIKQEQSDIYLFFAGHGLASDDGEKMYLLPYDDAPKFLDKTAILTEGLFADIAAANPRSVTVFLDTCYSGTTRGPDMLIAFRPIAIRAKEQAVPGGFTVMTAAAGDQTAKPLEEAKHGMFSYFLMKGMEGDADANQDNKITAGELHAYVKHNVIQQSSGSQTPELQGDVERVLVRFQ